MAFYTFTTYMQKFMINTSRIPTEAVTLINFAALLVFVVIQPLGVMLSDRTGSAAGRSCCSSASRARSRRCRCCRSSRWFKSTGVESLFFYYVAGCILVSLVTYWRMRETSRTSSMDTALEPASAPETSAARG